MRLTKFSHACVRIEDEGAVLVIDPGTLSERDALDGADAVLVTHEHPDHLDVDALRDALGKRPSTRVYTHPDVAAQLGDLAEVVTPVTAGDEFEAAGFHVRAYGGLHAIIHPDVPRIANVGVYVEEARLYHPGDSFEVPTDAEVETLLVPISAPWLKLSEAVDFVRQVAPRRAYALHDGLLNDAGLAVANRLLGSLTEADYARLTPGDRVDV
jgi:L-ascorbate metabolism protein UlaG (beta-lactamase superfamily)